MKTIQFNDTKSFSVFVKDEVDGSGLTQEIIGKRLGRSQESISQAVRTGSQEKKQYNKTRTDILNLFGYRVKHIISVEKINDK